MTTARTRVTATSTTAIPRTPFAQTEQSRRARAASAILWCDKINVAARAKAEAAAAAAARRPLLFWGCLVPREKIRHTWLRARAASPRERTHAAGCRDWHFAFCAGDAPPLPLPLPSLANIAD